MRRWIQAITVGILAAFSVLGGTVWLWSFISAVSFSSAGWNNAYGRLLDAELACGLMDDAQQADYLRLRKEEQEPAEFQTPGWEDRLSIPAVGWRIGVYRGILSLGVIDYKGMAPDMRQTDVSYHRSSGRFWTFGAWFRKSLPFSVQWAFFFRSFTSLFALLFLLLYPTIALVRGPMRRGRRRRSGRCVRCGYDLTGNVSRVCPECGTPSGAM